MHTSIWSLLLFTLLVQAGVGSFLLAQVTGKRKMRSVSLFLTAAGTGISFFHLGSPAKATFALNNLKSSWLSREILFALLFLALLILLFLIERKDGFPPALGRPLGLLTGLAGIALIFCMAKLYMLPTVPAWNSPATPITFFLTTLLLGAQIAALSSGFHVLRLRWLSLLSFVLLASQIAVTLLAFDLRPGGLFIARLILAAAAGFCLILLVKRLKQSDTGWKDIRLWAAAALTLIVVSECLGRYLFYAAYFRLGL
jgi:anaerobic dimethyl sulfoxide reductase subunit C (anchor subunit)